MRRRGLFGLGAAGVAAAALPAAASEREWTEFDELMSWRVGVLASGELGLVYEPERHKAMLNEIGRLFAAPAAVIR